MAQLIDIHPQTPQIRLVDKVANALSKGEIMAYPTTSGYALGCMLGNAEGLERIRKIRDLQEKQDWTLMCSSISQAAKFAKIDNDAFRTLRSLENGKYTFILKALPELSRRAQSKRGTIGVRIAQKQSIIDILETLDCPILSTSLLMPNDDDIAQGHQVHKGWSKGLELEAFYESYMVMDALDSLVDIVIESGEISNSPTTVVDLSGNEPNVIRIGEGENIWK